MRVGIDYTAAVRQGGGIGRYTRNLIRSLVGLDSENNYKLMVAGGWGVGDGLGAWPANVDVRSVPISDRWVHLLWQRLRLPVPVQAVTGAIDLFHSPDFVLPPTAGVPTILTVHDLSFLRVPQFFVPEFRKYLEGAVTRAVRQATHILADSESTRRDLLELMPVEAERVSVLYPAVEARFRGVEDIAELERVRRKYDLPGRFILGLSTLQPRKNFDGLVKAFRRLLDESGDIPEVSDLHLVIAGGKGWMYEELLKLAEQPGLAELVHLVGFTADEDLPALYSLATVFAFPSWYEGFGLPVLEAMACGTPVVAADNSSLPEVVGEAGLMVGADDTPALSGALRDLLTDGDLQARLVTAGREQAKIFTWEGAGKRLLEVYSAVA
jgi:glycosyltransferase involved in cell wall biosynthesis